ncbi:MAG: competence/damage-inducible protein A [Chthoniobacterales bacterium]
MRVIVLNTGTELLLGQVLNTHLTFVAREIFSLGLRVERQLTVPDGLPIRETLAQVIEEAEIVFVTGGLGPTTDDITREAAADLLGAELQSNAALIASITERLKTRGFPMTDRILRQAEVPRGAIVLPNDNGTAPGLYLRSEQKTAKSAVHLFLLPGPPRELEPMFRESVLPILRALVPGRSGIDGRTFRIAGVGESMVEAAVGSQILALKEIELGYCARAGEVDVRVIGQAAILDEAERILRGAFENSIFTTADENLEDVVVRLLTARKETVATAESCTGGYVANRLTNVAGASAVFGAGFVTYANEAKIAALGVEGGLIEKHGAVSAEVCRQMAEGARRKAGATHALATTGIAGPTGGSDEKPVGTVYIALASEAAETTIKRRRFLSDRETFKRLVSQVALEMLRQRLLGSVSVTE